MKVCRAQQRHAADAQLALFLCKASRRRRFERAADAGRSASPLARGYYSEMKGR